MLIPPAEESFQTGLRALDQGRRREAMALFEAAIELERRLGADRPQARYLSYYGLCLGLELSEIHEALRFCREAVRLENYNPNLHCNLGRVLLVAGKRREAWQSFAKGLELEPGHRACRKLMRRMGLRRRPPIPFLGRRNPVNVLLGRMRARSQRRLDVRSPSS